ncbi:MAG: glutamine synthetase, partial [SAR202 cluster bacterium]|nr:glutamine synthetase [SAR202 cluster bacterium]
MRGTIVVDSEDIEKVVRRATEANVQLVAFMYCDNAGVIRSKSTHIANLASRMRSGIGYSTTMQAMMVLDHILPFEGMTVVGEFRLMPDPKTFRVLPYDPRSAYMVGDMVTLDGKPYAACPREFLKRMCEQAREEMGFTLQASFEPEWTLATKEDGRVVPIDRTVAYSTIGMIPTRQLIHEMVDALVAQDIGVDIFHSEGGPGQQEITVHHTNAV